MRRLTLVAAAFLTLTALFLSPLTQGAYASQRYRSSGYRSSYNRYRPAYRGYTYRYRPYYGYGYRRPYYSYWPSFYSSWGFQAPYAHVRYSYYAGGAVDYSYAHGSVRTKVKPKQTEIYVDGYYAGIVDDFDGTFQRLYVPPGQHEVLLRLDGYRTHRQNLHVNSGSTIKVHHEMEHLGPGETTPPPPEPPKEQPQLVEEEMSQPHRDRYDEPPTTREDVGRPAEPRTTPSQEQAPPKYRSVRPPARFGLLALRVQPVDAQVFIDGELWGSLAGLDGLSIHLPTGRHRIEIRKEGFQSFVTEVDIRQGETSQLNVKLDGIEL